MNKSRRLTILMSLITLVAYLITVKLTGSGPKQFAVFIGMLIIFKIIEKKKFTLTFKQQVLNTALFCFIYYCGFITGVQFEKNSPNFDLVYFFFAIGVCTSFLIFTSFVTSLVFAPFITKTKISWHN